MAFESLGGEVKFEGKIATVSVERYRHDDGEEVTREKVSHPGAVGVLAVDDEHVWLTRQPREVVGGERVARNPGREAGSSPASRRSTRPSASSPRRSDSRRRAGKRSWPSTRVPGFSDERVWLYLADGLSDAPEAEADEHERIEIVRWPLDRLDRCHRARARTRSR